MSDAAPPPWVRLDSREVAEQWTGAAIEARRHTAPPELELRASTWNDIEQHSTHEVFEDGLGLWLALGPATDGIWRDALLVGDVWEIRAR